jgi:lipopolysaccharide export system protein LptA
MIRSAVMAALCLAGFSSFAAAQDGGALGGLGSSKDPVRIDAQNLKIIDKEQKAIYSGDVVVVQGKSTLRCSELVVFYVQNKAGSGQARAAGANGLRRAECKGPVSAVSGTSTVTGDNGVYDAPANQITVTGNVILTDCANVQKGDVLTYNMQTRVATVTGGRVSGLFEPNAKQGSGDSCE